MTETGLRTTDTGVCSCRGAAEAPVPEISRFFGIVITMYADERERPHFHAAHTGGRASIDILTLAIQRGRLHPRALGLVLEWAGRHRQELLENYRRLAAGRPPRRIRPLD